MIDKQLSTFNHNLMVNTIFRHLYANTFQQGWKTFWKMMRRFFKKKVLLYLLIKYSEDDENMAKTKDEIQVRWHYQCSQTFPFIFRRALVLTNCNNNVTVENKYINIR